MPVEGGIDRQELGEDQHRITAVGRGSPVLNAQVTAGLGSPFPFQRGEQQFC